MVFIFCCNWYPHKKLLKIKQHDPNIDGIMLQTKSPEIVDSDLENNCNKIQISILQLNAFCYLDRFWQRYPALILLFKQYSADIICLQEAITTDLWSFSSIKTLKQIDKTYNGFHISLYHLVYYYYPLLFRYSFIHYLISELQLLINSYIFGPFWLNLVWDAMLTSNVFIQCNFAILTGVSTHFGNAILFKNNRKLNHKSFIALDGMRNGIRSLYDMTDQNGKKVWIVSTHFSCQEEQKTTYSKYNDTKDNINNIRSITSVQCQQIVEWVEYGQKNIEYGDYIIICGDFNSEPSSNTYQFMIKKGYKSVVYEKYGNEKKTFTSGTWITNEEDIKSGILKTTLDYIWIKNCNDKEHDIDIQIDECTLVGNDYIIDNEVRIHASDHLGIYVKITL